VAEDFVDWLQDKLNESSLRVVWSRAASEFFGLMIEVVISPEKLRKCMNIDVFKSLLVLKSHTKV
jgi:hypothetical protein